MSSTLPILYLLDPSVAVTGAFVTARIEAQALSDRARVVLVLPEGTRIHANEIYGFHRVEYIPHVDLSKRLSALLRYMPALLRGSWKLHIMMKRDNAQHLQLNDFYLMQGVVLRILGYRGHIASWVRCEPKRFAGFLARPMLALQQMTSNRMVAVSAYIQSLLPQYHTSLLYKFYNGSVRTPRAWAKNEEKIFMYVGNYILGKGQDVALEAFAIAAAKDATIRLDFYGDDMGLQKNRDFRARLQERATELGLLQRVSFNGFVPDTYPLLELAFAALNCSVSESFSRTVFEASAAGLPVIATRSGGPQEILIEGETGYLVPVGDKEAIADRMLRLAQDPEAAATMGQAGAAHIKKKFSEEIFLKMLIEALGL